MKKITVIFVFLVLTSPFVTAYEICGEDVEILSIGNYSVGTGGPYLGDLMLTAIDQQSTTHQYEWRKRYGLSDDLVNQTMSLALYAKAAGRLVDIYCSVAGQKYNARFIVVK